jgi:hypothetical protein
MKEEPELKDATRWLMRGTAILFDLASIVSLVPVVGWILQWIVAIFYNLTFWVWFKMHGISFSNPKNLTKYIMGSLVELIPEIGILPGYSISIFLLTSKSKAIKTLTKNQPTKGNEVKYPHKNLRGVDELNKAA